MIASGGGSNLMSQEEIDALTPETIAERTTGSKWVFVSEQAMLIAIWSMKCCMLLIYNRLTYVFILFYLFKKRTIPYIGCKLLLLSFRELALTGYENSTGLKQRNVILYLAYYVGAGFVGCELAMFLSCRPFHDYWSVPAREGQLRNGRTDPLPHCLCSLGVSHLSLANTL